MLEVVVVLRADEPVDELDELVVEVVDEGDNRFAIIAPDPSIVIVVDGEAEFSKEIDGVLELQLENA